MTQTVSVTETLYNSFNVFFSHYTHDLIWYIPTNLLSFCPNCVQYEFREFVLSHEWIQSSFLKCKILGRAEEIELTTDEAVKFQKIQELSQIESIYFKNGSGAFTWGADCLVVGRGALGKSDDYIEGLITHEISHHDEELEGLVTLQRGYEIVAFVINVFFLATFPPMYFVGLVVYRLGANIIQQQIEYAVDYRVFEKIGADKGSVYLDHPHKPIFGIVSTHPSPENRIAQSLDFKRRFES